MALQLSRIQSRIHALRERIQSILWVEQLQSQTLWKRFLIRTSQIIVAVVRDLTQEQLSLRAMGLVFTTVIGFFPLFALTFAVLKSLGVHNAMEPTLLTLLQPLGERSAELTTQILSYVDNLQVELIGITSVGILLYIVLDMMRKIESSFNYIWAVEKGRSWSSRVSEYLFAVIVSPLLLFMSISLTSYINTNFFETLLQNLMFGGMLIEAAAFTASILLMSLAFAFAYSFLPNTKVQFSSAFIGGLVTTIIWKLMGSVFQGLFVASARENIYLAFASAIAVMFFIYIGWLVALVGSSIAYYHQNPAKTCSGRTKLALSIALALTIISGFRDNEAPLTESELAEKLHASTNLVEEALEAQEQIGLIAATSHQPPRYLPTHSVEDCTIVDIWRALRHCNKDKLALAHDSPGLRQIRSFQDDLTAAIERDCGKRKFIDLDSKPAG
jgi:membrane protein